MKLSELRTDPELLRKRNDGDWVPIPWLPGVRVRTRSRSCPGYRRMQERLLRQANDELQVGQYVDQIKRDAIDREAVMAECFMDWDGLLDEGEAPLPGSHAASYVENPEYERLWLAISWAANMVGQSDAALKAAAAKNSAASSDSSSEPAATSAG